MDNEDIFSYSSEHENTKKEVTGNQDSVLDLNSFSSGATEKASKKKRKKKRGKERFLKSLLTVFLIGIITVSIIIGAFAVYVFSTVDGTMEEDLNDLKLNFTTTIYVQDKNSGEWTEYQRLHGMFNRIWVPYDREAAETGDAAYTGIPQNLTDAFIAVEDKRFNDHNGVDWKRTVSAFANLFFKFYSSNQGGSTITQQLVKNLTGDTSRKPSRKIREIMRARYLEGKYSKDTIIECYMNTIAMGNGIYGVEVASEYYFGKSVNELTLAECASIASITKNPSKYAPDASIEDNTERRNTVLALMREQGYITEEEYEQAKAEELKVTASKEVLNETEVNSYFVDALIEQVTNDLADKYGYEQKHASNNFYSGGYQIYATVDHDMQEKLESVFEDTKSYTLKSKKGQTLRGGMTIMDYNGQVKAIAGGIGQKTDNRGFNYATDAVRQPGSTIKPIAAYAPAIEAGIVNYSSIVNDKATNYNGWTPVNWYKSYWGNITVQYALERSVNSIPVYLVNKLGTQNSYDFLTQKLGITTLNEEDINLAPLGMGGTNGGITTLESAAAFAIFGNGGLYYEPTLYTKVLDQKGKEILTCNSKPQVAISEDTADVMNHLLQQVVYGANGTGAGAKSFIPNMKIFAKTGTSNLSNDLWFVGGSPYYVASCWCGYDQMESVSKSSIARSMWGAAMSKIHSGLKAKEFPKSSYCTTRYYCTQSGMLATDACPSKAQGWYKKGGIPSGCTTHSGTTLGVPGTEEAETPKKENNTSSTASGTNSSNNSTTSSDNSSSTPSGNTTTDGTQTPTEPTENTTTE